ncbi:MAG TPA: M4 family metallopeptidase [Vicinamibacterales bacterium]|nr:M4 family metallopeptidase [Vicinamibacterales bacterium]
MKKLVYLAAILATSATLMFAQADPQQTATAVAQSTANARANALGTGHALVPVNVFVDDLGQAHVRYQQTFRGIPVFEGEAIVHVDLASRAVLDTTDALLGFGAIDTRPGLSAGNASARAREHFNLAPGLAEKNDLVVLVDNGVASLAWQVRMSGDDARGPVDKIAFVEAQGRGVLRSWDNVETAESPGTGYGFFNGTVSLTTNSITGGFELRDPSRGGQNTRDMNNRQNGNATIFTDSDNSWGTGALSNRQTVGVDAQYGTAQTWDYYKLVHSRNGIANDGKGAYNRVHYGRNYNNAFWSDSCFCMTYGDGDGITFNPFDSLDVAGHEMSHGVTSRSAKLTYSGESGGLNEGTSDIFGTAVEFYAANPNDVGDYLIGEKLYKSGTKALRSMIQPSTDGASADCWYSGVGSLNVHYSSGVANHFFYLLAEGTQFGSPSKTCAAGNTRVATGTGTVAAIGRPSAEEIWYRALTTYMTSGTNYAGARTATLNAAKDLFGAGSPQQSAVAAAWSAVNVNVN